MPEAPSYPDLAETVAVRPRRPGRRSRTRRAWPIGSVPRATSRSSCTPSSRASRSTPRAERVAAPRRRHRERCQRAGRCARVRARVPRGGERAVAARLRRRRSPEGSANASGMVGRCFMDHPHVDAGRVHFSRAGPEASRVSRRRTVTGSPPASLAPQPITDAASCLQYFCRLLPVEHGHDGADAAARLARTWRHPRAPRFRASLAQRGARPGARRARSGHASPVPGRGSSCSTTASSRRRIPTRASCCSRSATRWGAVVPV